MSADASSVPGGSSAVRAVPLRIVLYVLAALAAAAALFVEPALNGAVRRGALHGRWLFLPSGIFTVFLLAYAVDRVLLVRRRRYPTGKAVFQVAFGAIFALMLLPSTIRDYQHHREAQPSGISRLVRHPDPDVRASATFAFGYQGRSRARAQDLLPLLSDPNAQVRAAAVEVLSGWSGKDPGDVAGIQEWASALSGTSSAAGE